MTWGTEILAIFRKEAQSELRSRSGLVTSGLFGMACVVTLALASFTTKLSGDIAAGLLWVAILFSAVLALPRTFLLEEEQGTADLLRLTARPHAVFWGKALFNLSLTTLTSAGITLLFCLFTSVPVAVPWLLALTVFGGCAALTGSVTLCGALVARATNRAALAAAVSIPLLMPVLSMGISGLRVAFAANVFNQASSPFTEALLRSGTMAALGLVGYSVASLVMGPWLYAAVWKS